MQNPMQAFPAAAVSVPATSAAAEAPDFDFQMPCRYFKSSFARSLSLNNNNNNSSNCINTNGNGSIALTLAKKSPQIEAKQQQQQQQQESAQESPCSTPPPALPARRYTSTCNNNNNSVTHFNTSPANQLQQQQQHLQQQQQQMQRNLNLATSWSMQQDASHVAAPNNNNNNNNNCINHSYNNLPQQQHSATAAATTHEQTLNVEAVILQNQVDTLHWQLKQTETNCEMYRAVMEEVARFFERYQQQQQLQQQQQQQQRSQQLPTNRYSLGGVGEQIARSKSLHHVLQGVQMDPNGGLEDATNCGNSNTLSNANASNSASYLRARSSTNLMLNKSMLTMNEEASYESIAPAGSYNAFKDFTWRRSPKKLGGCKSRLSTAEAAEEKLNQEAFRLARTIRNLLHTSEQQPDLTQPRHSMGGGVGHRLGKQQLTLHAAPLHNSTSLIDANPGKNCNDNSINNNNNNGNAASSAEMLFLRSNTMRDSRLSLRSSTDSSVHSTISSTASSSSKIETDEELTASNNNNNSSGNNINNKQIKPAGNGSSTEDESGFSSISSFHDVGLPLSSTLIGGRLSESRNSTLKSALNVVGVPLPPQQPQPPSQSPAKTYRNANRYQRFSTLSNEDAAAVLWV